MLKAVILVGGPQKGTRFRPLSFDIPKPLFPIAGFPTIQHLIDACCKVPGMKEIILLGFYQPDEAIVQFTKSMTKEQNVDVRYLQEYISLGTAGGIHHFRDHIRSGGPESFFVINGDVCGNFPLAKLAEFHKRHKEQILLTLLGTEATRQQSQQYGCIVENKKTHEVMHYVEKPSTFVSNTINCGVYICSLEIFHHLASVFKKSQKDSIHGIGNCIQLEQDIIMPLAGHGKILVYNSCTWWSQIKTAGSAIYANRHYLELYHSTHIERLAKNASGKPRIIDDVYIHPTAQIHPTATLGPNVSIGKNVFIGEGVRIRESIVLGNATIQGHSLILYSIIGWNSTIGNWARIEGTPCDPNPNKAVSKMENNPLFNNMGQLNPSITVLGCNVQVRAEVIVLNCIVLPYKDLSQSYKNEIIL